VLIRQVHQQQLLVLQVGQLQNLQCIGPMIRSCHSKYVLLRISLVGDQTQSSAHPIGNEGEQTKGKERPHTNTNGSSRCPLHRRVDSVGVVSLHPGAGSRPTAPDPLVCYLSPFSTMPMPWLRLLSRWRKRGRAPKRRHWGSPK